MTAAIITIVAGRRNHLARQCVAIDRFAPGVEHVIVDMGGDLADVDGTHRTVIRMPGAGSPLPLAQARNIGAAAAIRNGADELVFLDVDCIPSSQTVSRYRAALDLHPDAVLTAPVGYLSAEAAAIDPTDGDALEATAHFHDFRPRPDAGLVQTAGHHLFWSLSFALTGASWTRIGGFDESYRGYGAEDTDFGERARLAGAPLLFVGGATAYHQHHSVESPPVRHLDDILRNGRTFAARWGYWPMQGWLDGFEATGLIIRDEATGDYRKAAA